MDTYTSARYLVDDHPRTLFPLSNTKVMVERHSEAILNHIRTEVLKDGGQFSSQENCYASKQGFHLRRTVRLDPVAELFVYDVVYRNRQHFRRDFSPTRRSFGYQFRCGRPVSGTEAYGEFRKAVADAKQTYRHALKFDVAAYFNSLYHHYVRDWFAGLGAPAEDVTSLSRFLLGLASGDSIDCLPQGIHPCKMIGADFLKLVDNYAGLGCELLLRFMDDFYLFSDHEPTLITDFLTVQRLLGQKGLSVNASKTALGAVGEVDLPRQVDELKAGLLRERRRVIQLSGLEPSVEEPWPARLDAEQTEYLLHLLNNSDIDESDAELVLALLHDHGADVLARMGALLARYPSLMRSVYGFSRHVDDRSTLSALLLDFVKHGTNATEDQLFWIAKLAEDYLADTDDYGSLLFALYQHTNASTISRAKVLEIPDTRHGMPDLRRGHITSGASGWLAWAAAMGSRGESRARRNHPLKYFANASAINRLIADCVTALPEP